MDQSKLRHLSLVFSDSERDTAPDYPSILQTIPNCLPTTLLTIQLDFGGFSENLMSEHTWAHWKAIDAALTASQFREIRFVGIMWKIPRSFQEQESPFSSLEGVKQRLETLDRDGVFKRTLPGLYSRKLLWCGEWLSRRFIMVYPGDWQSLPSRPRARYEQFDYRALCRTDNINTVSIAHPLIPLWYGVLTNPLDL